MKNKLLIVCVLLIAGISLSIAQNTVVKKHQINQQKRIHQGIHNGELTLKEVHQLEKQQYHIQQTKQRAKADGIVTKREKAIIHSKQQKANHNIYRKKHNAFNRN